MEEKRCESMGLDFELEISGELLAKIDKIFSIEKLNNLINN